MAIRSGTGIDLLLFVALLSTALALGAALAHALELPNKISLSEHEYFIVQKAYQGWDRLAFLLLVELGSMSAVAVQWRHEPRKRYETQRANPMLSLSSAASSAIFARHPMIPSGRTKTAPLSVTPYLSHQR
jgi:hypothetical protein